MNSFQMYWNPSAEERVFNDYTILTMMLSVLQWKATNDCKLSFYGDGQTVKLLERLHLAGLWDKCDGTLLDREIDREHYNCSVFYSIGKFIALLHESCPCAMLDTDLVIWKNLASVLDGKDAAFTHWEDTTPPSVWYCAKENLPVPPGYRFHPAWDFNTTAANTSFIYFKNSVLRDYYAECAMHYMYDNPYKKKAIGNSAILFAEQRLFTMCIDERGDWKKTMPLLDITWNAKKGRFLLSDTLPEGWEFFQPDNNSIATHIWIAKAQIEKNKPYKIYFCCRLIEKIRSLDKHMEEILTHISSIQPYLKLLDTYGSTGRMLETGIVTKELYPPQMVL